MSVNLGELKDDDGYLRGPDGRLPPPPLQTIPPLGVWMCGAPRGWLMKALLFPTCERRVAKRGDRCPKHGGDERWATGADPSRRCTARSNYGGHCQFVAVRGSRLCRYHGEVASGPQDGPPGLLRRVQALRGIAAGVAGAVRFAWVEARSGSSSKWDAPPRRLQLGPLDERGCPNKWPRLPLRTGGVVTRAASSMAWREEAFEVAGRPVLVPHGEAWSPLPGSAKPLTYSGRFHQIRVNSGPPGGFDLVTLLSGPDPSSMVAVEERRVPDHLTSTVAVCSRCKNGLTWGSRAHRDQCAACDRRDRERVTEIKVGVRTLTPESLQEFAAHFKARARERRAP